MRLLCAVAALFLLASALASAQPSLLGRAAAASGEPWRYHIVSRIAETEVGHLVETRIDEEDSRVVTRRCIGSVCSGTIVDASKRSQSFFSYNATPIAQSAPLDPQSVTLRAIASYAFTSPSFSGTVEEKDPTHAGTREVVPFAVTAPGGETLDALLDPTTALLAGVAEGRRVLYLYEDQHPVGPLVLPMRVRRVDQSVVQFESRSVDPGPLTAPAGPPLRFLAGAPAARLEPGAIPRFPCRIEGTPVTCMLDTGASGLAMSLALADRLHKSPFGLITLEGVGDLASGVVRASSLDLGSLRVGPALYAILPDVGGVGVDVVVGADVIGASTVRLDPRRHSIRFDPPGAPLDGTLVDLRFDGFTPSMPFMLGSTPCRLALDTGDASSIDLSSAFAAQNPGLFVSLQRRGVIGVGGRGFQSIGTIARVQFAGFTLHDVTAGTTDIPGTRAPSRVGAAFFDRFLISLDYANSRMSVRLLR